MDASTLLQFVNTGGVLALLIFFVWAFYDGQIISKKSLDKILDAYRQQTEMMLKDAIKDILDEVRKNKTW
jgi:uncharacterized membrane protein